MTEDDSADTKYLLMQQKNSGKFPSVEKTTKFSGFVKNN